MTFKLNVYVYAYRYIFNHYTVYTISFKNTAVVVILCVHSFIRYILSSTGGSDGNICIYKNNSSSTGYRDEHCTTLLPIFTHIGHQVSPIHLCDDDPVSITVWYHCWHPDLKDALLSCASDGSLHAWQLKSDLPS